MYAGTVSGGDEGTETASGDDKGLYPKIKVSFVSHNMKTLDKYESMSKLHRS